MNFLNVHKIFFLGVGGIGMSALARYFLWAGKYVAGYDRNSTPLTRELSEEGVVIQYDQQLKDIPRDIDMVVYTPAIPAQDPLMQYFRENKIPMYKRAEVLGMISANVPCIAIAGTHGKTTITSMLAHIFHTAGVSFSAFLGGISANYNTNFMGSADPRWMIVEADEYDRSFLHLHPSIAVITSMDADHLDVYGDTKEMEVSFRSFIKNIKTGGTLITHASLSDLKNVFHGQQSYALEVPADYTVGQVVLENGRYQGWIHHHDQKRFVQLGMPGRHNFENALAAIAAAVSAGIDWPFIEKALASCKGVKRRFEIHLLSDQIVYIDDYAHHPQEINSCVASAREFFPDRKITGIFQPHLFSRTRDLAREFARSLDQLDQVVLMDIYPAREQPLEDVDSGLIVKYMKNPNVIRVADKQLLDYVKNHHADVLLTMGAGNIDQFVEPIKEILER